MGLSTDFLNYATRQHFIRPMRNNIYNKPAVMNRLFAKGRVKTLVGRGLLWDVVAKKHAAKGVYSGYDVLASQPVNPVKQASLEPANYYATVAISGDEERKNSGTEERLINMLKTQFDNASSTLKDDMSTHLYGSGGLVGGVRVLEGFGSAITQATGTYAGFDRSDAANTFWRSNADATAYTKANLKDPTSTSYMPGILRKSYLAASFDDSPDLIVMTKDNFQLYQDIASAQNLQIFNEEANLGFRGVKFAGGAGPNVGVIFDDYCTANYIYMLTLGDWTVWVYPSANFDMKEPGWQIPNNQDAKSCHIIWSGQLCLQVPRQQAVLSSVGAT
jgi:hypothetical protein